MKSEHLFMQFCVMQLDISLHPFVREKAEGGAYFTNSERTLGLQATWQFPDLGDCVHMQ